jgi:hypothetical protein
MKDVALGGGVWVLVLYLGLLIMSFKWLARERNERRVI